MKKYNEYKDSGVDYLIQIPSHWEIERLKDVFSFRTGLSITKKNLQKVGVPCVNYGEIHSKFGFVLDPEVHPLKCVSEDYLNTSKKALLKKGDFVFADTSEDIEGSGNFTYLNSNIPVFAGYHTIVAKPKFEFKYRYVAYLFDSSTYRAQFQSSVSGIKVFSITQSLLKKLFIYFPTQNEQIQIVNYLDAKTKNIDEKIKLLKKKIKNYKTYRKILINETITKGLNGDVSSWVRFRLKDLGYLYSGLSGKSGDDFNQDDNPNNKGFIPFTNIANNTYLNKKQLGTVVINDNERQNQVKKNDIFFLMSSEGYEDIGKSAVLIEDLKETYLNSFCKGFRLTNKNSDASFINYLLLSDTYRQQMLVEGKGFTRINLKMEKVNNFSILIPPTKKEQQQIADFLNAKTTTIDNIINNIETQITTLKKLRKTLINEVVTGKIKVTA